MSLCVSTMRDLSFDTYSFAMHDLWRESGIEISNLEIGVFMLFTALGCTCILCYLSARVILRIVIARVQRPDHSTCNEII